MTSLYRTDNPKFVTYWGDGNGRDHYITFNNGGLNEQRMHGKDTKIQWRDTKMGGNLGAASKGSARKEATALRYWGDGSGRDHHVIFDQGQMRDHRSDFQGYQKQLRQHQPTPNMDRRQIIANSPRKPDLSLYNNWYSPSQRTKFRTVAQEQRQSIERLSQSPKRPNTIISSFNYQNDTPNADSIKKTLPATGQGIFKSFENKHSHAAAMSEYLDHAVNDNGHALQQSLQIGSGKFSGSNSKLQAKPFFPPTNQQRNMTPAISGKRMPLAPVELLGDKAMTKLRQSSIIAISDLQNQPNLLLQKTTKKELNPSVLDTIQARIAKTSQGQRPKTLMETPTRPAQLIQSFDQQYKQSMNLPIKRGTEKMSRFQSGSTAPSTCINSTTHQQMQAKHRNLATADQKNRTRSKNGNILVKTKLSMKPSDFTHHNVHLNDIVDNKIVNQDSQVLVNHLMRTHQQQVSRKVQNSSQGSYGGF